MADEKNVHCAPFRYQISRQERMRIRSSIFTNSLRSSVHMVTWVEVDGLWPEDEELEELEEVAVSEAFPEEVPPSPPLLVEKWDDGVFGAVTGLRLPLRVAGSPAPRVASCVVVDELIDTVIVGAAGNWTSVVLLMSEELPPLPSAVLVEVLVLAELPPLLLLLLVVEVEEVFVVVEEAPPLMSMVLPPALLAIQVPARWT
jgi:hypothetical protein